MKPLVIILEEAARHFCCEPAAVLDVEDRRRNASTARMAFVRLAKDLTSLTYPEITQQVMLEQRLLVQTASRHRHRCKTDGFYGQRFDVAKSAAYNRIVGLQLGRRAA